MQALLERMRNQEVMKDLEDLLDLILPYPELHARLVNTMARMEYVGVRKMLKARRSESLDIEGLRHVLEEASHALRLKKAAIALAGGPRDVETFSEAHTLAGESGEGYLQAVDHACETALGGLEEPLRTEANYLLSSALIEFRAEVFYPVYENRLQAHNAPFSVSGIMRDEERHLEAMAAGLDAKLPEWKTLLEEILEGEEEAFKAWIAAIAEGVPRPVAAG